MLANFADEIYTNLYNSQMKNCNISQPLLAEEHGHGGGGGGGHETAPEKQPVIAVVSVTAPATTNDKQSLLASAASTSTGGHTTSTETGAIAVPTSYGSMSGGDVTRFTGNGVSLSPSH